MREFLARLRDWLHRDSLDAELGEELRFHRQLLERDTGVDAARRQLGNVTRVHEDARDRWSIPWLDHVQQDVRYTLRGLRRSPGFTVAVVLTLGLGLGANAAMFEIIDQLMFRPAAHLREAERVDRVYLQRTDRGRDRLTHTIPFNRYLDFARWTTSFSGFAGFGGGTQALGAGDGIPDRPVANVTASFFDFFDVRPALGRFFDAREDSTPHGALEIVLSYGYWRSQFGGRDVVGEPLQVRDKRYTIVGVAPEGFVGVADQEAPAAWIPITSTNALYARGADDATDYRGYEWGSMSVMVRRKPGVSASAASADLTSAYRRSWDAERALDAMVAPIGAARPRAIVGALKIGAGPEAGLEAKTLLWVAGVSLIVLLIACANVTNLMFARVLRRRREIALRLALGVSRHRLAGQFFTESLVLAMLGCAAGVAIAQVGGGVLRRLLVRYDPPAGVIDDARTLAFVFALALAVGALTAIGPALLAVRGNLAGALRAGARDGAYQRSGLRSALLVSQGALSVILLVGAGLFVRSLDNARSMRLGYDADRVLFVTRHLRGMQLTTGELVAQRQRLLETAQRLPTVEYAAWVGSVPFVETVTTRLFVPGIGAVRRLGWFAYQATTPDYFRAMGTRILRGRAFSEDDRAGAPRVVVVSEAMARVLWPGQDALGQCIRVDADTMPCTTVIGIAENAVQTSLTSDARLQYYLPIDQYRPEDGWALVLRMRGDPAREAENVRRALQPVMPGQSYVSVAMLGEIVDAERRSWEVGATMFVAFGALALVVAAVGLYGLISYNVAQRMHEIGVRVALGAQAGDVVRLVVGQGVSFAVAGVGIGLALAMVAARWIQPLLFEQSARDPLTYAVVGALLVVVAVVASAWPAFRATRADPNSALRAD